MTRIFCVIGGLLMASRLTALAGVEPIDLTKPPAADAHTVVLLRFDEVKDGLAWDESGRGNHGAVQDAQPVEGRFGGALKFDGDDDYVDLRGERHDRPDLDFGETTDFTVEFWFKTTSEYRWAHLINKKCRGDATEAGWMIFLHLGRVRAAISDGVNQVALTEAPIMRNDGRWHHVALVADRRGDAVLYVDGQPGEPASMKVLLDINNTNHTLRIGDRAHDGDYEGLIDEVRISRVARPMKTD